MKKTISLLCVILVISLLFTGCSAKTEKITKLSDLEGKVVATMSSPQDPKMVQALNEQLLSVKFKEMQIFDSFSAAVAALKSGQVDAVGNAIGSLEFYAKRDDSLLCLPYDLPGTTTVHMALRAADTELLEQINAALLSLRNDGTLAELQSEWIDNLSPEMQLLGKNLPVIDGAPTLRVGISGDLPPLDYVAADGKPAGYNVELLSLLSEMLGMNIEVLVMPTNSKFPSLSSNKIDVFFFQAANSDIEMANKTLEANSNAVLTESYYTVPGVGVLVLK